MTREASVSSDSASVEYSTTDGTASERSDYTPASGTLTFDPGETSRTFKVLINNNGYVEGTRTVNLILQNASGAAALGSQNTAVLRITDTNSIEPPVNPSDDAEFFVRQQYYDFLNREPDADGLNYWTNQITLCGADVSCLNARRRDVSAAFFIEPEFQDTGFFTYRFYKASFAQQPNYLSFIHDRARVASGADLESNKTAFANQWVERADFLLKYPDTMTAELYVDALNYNSAGVLAPSERDALVQGLKSGSETRATVLSKVVDNLAFKQQEYNSAFVLTQYFGYLRRDPEQGGYDFWLNIMNDKVPNDASGYRAMVCAFITSNEYQDRFGSRHSHSDAECGP